MKNHSILYPLLKNFPMGFGNSIEMTVGNRSVSTKSVWLACLQYISSLWTCAEFHTVGPETTRWQWLIKLMQGEAKNSSYVIVLRSWLFIWKRSLSIIINQEAILLKRIGKKRQKKVVLFFFRNCLPNIHVRETFEFCIALHTLH